MKKMPKRDTNGKCEGKCLDRVSEGEQLRQKKINEMRMSYSTPAEKSPEWTQQRNDPPGSMGGRV